jgi:hypothetical protein
MKFFDNRFKGYEGEVMLIIAGFYRDGSPRLDLVSTDGCPWATCTSCLDKPPAPDCVFIKNYTENEGMVHLLIKNGVIHPKMNSNYNNFPEFKLTDAVIALVNEARKEFA